LKLLKHAPGAKRKGTVVEQATGDKKSGGPAIESNNKRMSK